jgi:uncharacterized membrane protein YqhA
MAESVIEEVLALKRWMIVCVAFSVLSFLVLLGIGVGLKVAGTAAAQTLGAKLEELAQENKQLREENLKLMQRGARGY